MTLNDLNEPQPEKPLIYGDKVKTKSKSSMYANRTGKIVEVTRSNIKVRFEGIKRPVIIFAEALERI